MRSSIYQLNALVQLIPIKISENFCYKLISLKKQDKQKELKQKFKNFWVQKEREIQKKQAKRRFNSLVRVMWMSLIFIARIIGKKKLKFRNKMTNMTKQFKADTLNVEMIDKVKLYSLRDLPCKFYPLSKEFVKRKMNKNNV